MAQEFINQISLACVSLGGFSEVFPPAYFLSTYTSLMNCRTLSTLLHEAIKCQKTVHIICRAKRSAIKGIVVTCCQAIAAFEGPNLSSRCLLHAGMIEWLVRVRNSNPLFAGTNNFKPTWLPPFWSASTSWEVNLAMDTDFTRWVNSRLDWKNRNDYTGNMLQLFNDTFKK